MNTLTLWRDTPTYSPKWLPGASLRANVTPEYLGVGYIIGPRIAGVMFAGGVFSWLLMMPAIQFFGSLAPNLALYPSTVPIPLMTSDQLWSSYIRPMGAGAVAAAGVITLLKTLPTIWHALQAGLKDLRAGRESAAVATSRTERDLSIKIVLVGSIVILVMMWALLTFRPVPGAQTSLGANAIAAIFVLVFGFLFVTVSARICGLIGTSSNPISGMAIATLMATCAMFLVAGWTRGNYAVLALTIGGVVCIAAANAGGTSQDLKTGYLVGATPSKQQIALIIGAMASVFAVGLTLKLMNAGLAEYHPVQIAVDIANLPSGAQVETQDYQYHNKSYVLINALGSSVIPDGKYLYDAGTHQIEIQWIQGIGSDKAAAPQARLMATVINGILNRKLPWRLVLLGVSLVIAIELLGVRSLPFAVGSYLSIATTAAIFAGGVVRWLVERTRKGDQSDIGPGPLYASGLIAGGAMFGLLGIVITLLADADTKHRIFRPGMFQFAQRIQFISKLANSHLFAVLMFALLASSQYYFARKKLE